MKRITFLVSLLIAMSYSTSIFGQVYEVGATKLYPNISAVWDVIKENDETNITIYVDEGEYVEKELAGLPNKHITIIGAGADKTIVMRSNVDFPFVEEYGASATDGRVNIGYLFRSPLAGAAENYHLVCERITFKNIGTNRANWAGALVVTEVINDQSYTFKNCMFTNINARQGTLVGATPGGATTTATVPLKIVFEDCFVESCYVHTFNNLAGFFNFKFGGDLTIKNTTFMNNRVGLTNLNGTDEYPGAGIIVSMPVPASSAAYTSNITIDNVNILNTDIIGGAETTYVSMVKMAVVEGEDGTLPPTPTCSITGLTSINNVRNGSEDSDLFFTAGTVSPVVASSAFNAVRNIAENAVVEELEGAKIDTELTYTSPQVNFEMEGELPKIFVNEYGVKYLKKSPTSGLNSTSANKEPFNVAVKGGVVTISNLKAGEQLSVYDYSGKLVKNIVANKTTVNFSLNRGMYILHGNNKIAKVVL